MKTVKILAIESSFDETAGSILEGDLESKMPQFQILSEALVSQIAAHQKTGGIVPEVAAREHIKNIKPIFTQTLELANLQLKDIDYLAVTSGPGLIVSLLVGVEFVKGLSIASGIPIIPTNHMIGHIYSILGGDTNQLRFPAIVLVVSGGHTQVVLLKSFADYEVLGGTLDDAAGEAFDKVARLLDLPYPGGPEISKLAEKSKNLIDFPRPMMNKPNYDFSFSGLKTAVLYHIDKLSKPLTEEVKADIAYSFEQACVDVLVSKTIKATHEFNAKTVCLVGGVSANKRLRNTLATVAESQGINHLLPPMDWCTDNAKMIAVASYINLRNGYQPGKTEDIKADSNWEL